MLTTDNILGKQNRSRINETKSGKTQVPADL